MAASSGPAVAEPPCTITLFAANAMPEAFNPESFRREFAREGLATSRCRVFERAVDILDTVRLVGQVDDALKVPADLIVAPASIVALAVRARNTRTPTLFVAVASPETIGLVANPAEPEANLTGLTYAMQEDVKTFEVAREVAGPGTHVGVIVDRFWPTLRASLDVIEAAQRDLGVRAHVFAGNGSAEVLGEIAAYKGAPIGAWIVMDTTTGRDEGDAIVRALRHRPGVVIVNVPELLDAGAHVLMHPVIESPTKTLAEMGDLILRGVPVSRIPVARPKRFRVVMNLTAVEATPGMKWGRLMAITDKFRRRSDGPR